MVASKPSDMDYIWLDMARISVGTEVTKVSHIYMPNVV